MSIGQVIRLATMGLIFLAWAWLMFRTLFLFRRREVERSGAMFPSTGGFLHQLGHWLKSPEDRTDRRTLLFLTVILFVMTGLQALTIEG